MPENRTCPPATPLHELSLREAALLTEIEELGRTIEAAKAEIAALRVDDITGNHIPFATDELDAIVTHTARATNEILESCETLDAVAADASSAHGEKLQAAVTRIYEACSFQDITGQRITKVVNTLKAIEAKVAQIAGAFGTIPASQSGKGQEAPVEPILLNGPQLPAAAMDQADIDKLLASFD
jgi:chemotaxis protein CheZ